MEYPPNGSISIHKPIQSQYITLNNAQTTNFTTQMMQPYLSLAKHTNQLTNQKYFISSHQTPVLPNNNQYLHMHSYWPELKHHIICRAQHSTCISSFPQATQPFGLFSTTLRYVWALQGFYPRQVWHQLDHRACLFSQMFNTCCLSNWVVNARDLVFEWCFGFLVFSGCGCVRGDWNFESVWGGTVALMCGWRIALRSCDVGW